MPNGDEVAVKKFHDSSLGLDDDCFSNEFENLIRMVHHPNIVRIVSYCYEQEKVEKEINGQSVEVLRIYRVLCFEYLPKGSLDRYLSGTKLIQCYTMLVNCNPVTRGYFVYLHL